MTVTIDWPASPAVTGQGSGGVNPPLWVDLPVPPSTRAILFGFDLADAPVHRWKLWDALTGETYFFEMNPNSMSTPYPGWTTTSTGASPITGQISGLRQPKVAFEWTFSGLIRTQTFQDALQTWFDKDHKFYLTDHVGRRWLVMPESFGPFPRPDRRKKQNSNEHRWQYDAKVINYGPG